MFIGHYAPALLAATLPRAPRLGPLFLAAQLVDFALFLLIWFEVEHIGFSPGLTAVSGYDLWDVRWSHSLLGSLGWSAGMVVAVKLLTRDARAAWIAGAVAASHWFLDFVVHPPDLTLLGAGPRFGWALWDQPYIAMPLELLIAFTAFAWYWNRTRATDWRGRWSTIALAVTAVAFQLAMWLLPQPTEPVFQIAPEAALAPLAALTIVTVLAWWTGDTRVPRR
jgi:hypothetical protein